MTALWWIRRDVRLADNPTLDSAMKEGGVIPVFILDPHLLAKTPQRRQAFLFNGLRVLDDELQQRGSHLVVRKGHPLEILTQLLAETSAASICAEEDFTLYARQRDALIQKHLPLKLIHGQTVHHPLLVLKADGTPYTVFTPYSKAWKTRLTSLTPLSAPIKFQSVSFPSSANPLPESVTQSALFPPGEIEAQRRLNQFTNHSIYDYADARNRLDLDGTSSLSPYLRFGMLAMRQAASAALNIMQTADHDNVQHTNAETWLNELIWREFYISILYHFPYVAGTAFNKSLANIAWRNDESEFEAWKAGLTGVPVVDAGMRQLKQTGWMHNRARMIVASFLVKDLLINWQWGEGWFMDNLLDGDPAANNGGWQWTAGTGTDAAPYFRIFNPVLQSHKFDPEGNYIRKWIPELAHLDSSVIHAPWEKGIKVSGYPPKPIVDHAQVKDRTLKAYQASKALFEKPAK